ncbi:VOC family protein [Microbacterium insulae]|uniref:VOC family protein n=1 Tax=Microbacterium insulae TaxID=483014 RepID=A0ABW3AF74_9MICO
MTAEQDRRLADGLSEQSLHASVDQVAYLVPDLADGIREWNSLLGEQEWIVYEYSAATLPRLGFRGGPGKFVMRLALAGAGPQIELIQPVRGPSIYHEWVQRRGYGPHHVGRFVADIDAAMDSLRRVGKEPVQWGAGYGLDGDGGFAYYELGPDDGTIVELIQPPRRRRTPESI